jgi:predicted CxxxxCH...CXXCH cytochrome family protein
VDAANITLLGDAGYPYSTPSWLDSTWGSGTDISYTDTSDFACDNVRCHGGESVVFNQVADAGTTNYTDVCYNCHNITPASFQLPGGTFYQATNAAANYVGPISGFSRGGHGDTGINDPAWFENVAPGYAVPLGCTACHDESKDHFPVATSNPYRVSDDALSNTLPGADGAQTRITNLCIQTGCHDSSQAEYKFLEPAKHPSDHYTAWDSGTSETLVSETGLSVLTTFDPDGAGVGTHIDQYVDHWEFWGGTGASPASNDDARFLPLDDSLSKTTGDIYNNVLGDRVTCITCHNPHGTDLFVSGETPGSGSTTSLPNGMLRLRDRDDELCGACHR